MKTKELKELLHYDPETGIFLWALSRGFIVKGTRAGGLFQGRVYITINGKRHLASRLAWQYVKGHEPAVPVRYVNGDKTDLCIKNLSLRKIKNTVAKERIDVGIETTLYGYRVVSFVHGEALDLGTYSDWDTAANVQRWALDVPNQRSRN